MKQNITFYRGKRKFYNKTLYENLVYFAPDTKEIIVNDICYGVSSTWETKILNSITSIAKDSGGSFIAKTHSGQQYRIDFSEYIEGAILAKAEDLTSSLTTGILEVKTELEELVENSVKDVKDSVNNFKLDYNDEDHKVTLSLFDGQSTGFDATPFIKDGMLEDIQYIDKAEEYYEYDENGNKKTDDLGNVIKFTYTEVPFLKLIFNTDWAEKKGITIYDPIVRLPVNKLKDTYEGKLGIEVDGYVIKINDALINSLGIQQTSYADGTSDWKLVYTSNPLFISPDDSVADALFKLDQLIKRLTDTDKGTVEVVDYYEDGGTRITNKYVNVELNSAQAGISLYIVKEDLDNTLMGWEEIE